MSDHDETNGFAEVLHWFITVEMPRLQAEAIARHERFGPYPITPLSLDKETGEWVRGETRMSDGSPVRPL